MLNDLVFKFMDEFFLAEAEKPLYASKNCQKERWSICQGCEHFDELEEGCKECGCYLPHKIKDQWGDCPLDKWISNDEEWKSKYYNELKDVIIEKYPEYQELIERHEGIN